MQSEFTGHVTSAEWRWVIWVSCGLILLAFAPFLWLILSGVADTRWEFMGALHDHQNNASYLSKVFQGSQGRLATLFLHTPESHDGTLFDLVYLVLGQLARLTSLPSVVLFHVGRVAASLFMYLALYQLSTSIWMRIRTRRIFFVMSVVGSGFGWLLAPLTGEVAFLDLTAPEIYPFYSSLVNVHYPLSIGFLALMASVIIVVFRPGIVESPGVNNEGVMLFLLGIAFPIVYPIGLLPIMVAFVVFLFAYWYQHRAVSMREVRWLLWFVVPTLPVLVYYVAVLYYRPVISELWFGFNAISSPSIPLILASFGLPLLIALPALYRAVRRFEPDGDQFMLIWLLVILVMMLLPSDIQRPFSIGLMIPIAYFMTRALEDFWFEQVPRRYRYRVLAALIPVMGASLLFVLFLPIRPITVDNMSRASGIVLQRDYDAVFTWLRQRARSSDVVLAAPDVSLWLPSRSGVRVVHALPRLTLESDSKQRAVNNWFAATEVEQCEDLLQGDYSFRGSYLVRYVIIGPQERALGTTLICTSLLEPLQTFNNGRVTLYAYSPNTVLVP